MWSYFNCIMDKTATVYTVDKSDTTQSGQPVEVLVERVTTKCAFTNNIRNVWKLFDAGQIKIGDFVLLTTLAVETGEVVEIDSEKYLIESATEIKIPGNKRPLGYRSYLTRYKH